MPRFRNDNGKRIRVESGARMNDDTCCCVPFCDEVTGITGNIQIIISGVTNSPGINCGGPDGCNHVYNRTLIESIDGGGPILGTCPVAPIGEPGYPNCGIGFYWVPADLGTCVSFAERSAFFITYRRGDTSDYYAFFTLGRGFGERASWSKDYGSINPSLPLSFGPADYEGECNGGELCDFSAATITVAYE